jgi:hypothetical protein
MRCRTARETPIREPVSARRALPTSPAARPLGFALQPANLRFKGGPWGVRASPGAMAIFPPLTAHEEAVLEVLASGAGGEYTAELIAERAGLGREQARKDASLP